MYEMRAMKCPGCGETMKGGKCPNGCKAGGKKAPAKKGGVPPQFLKKKK